MGCQVYVLTRQKEGGERPSSHFVDGTSWLVPCFSLGCFAHGFVDCTSHTMKRLIRGCFENNRSSFSAAFSRVGRLPAAVYVSEISDEYHLYRAQRNVRLMETPIVRVSVFRENRKINRIFYVYNAADFT